MPRMLFIGYRAALGAFAVNPLVTPNTAFGARHAITILFGLVFNRIKKHLYLGNAQSILPPPSVYKENRAKKRANGQACFRSF